MTYAPGLYPDMPAAEYHAELALSNSGAKHLLRSIGHFAHYVATPFESTPAMILGDVVHTLVLEPDLFNARYLVAPNVDKRTKAGKSKWESIQQRAGERDIIAGDVHDKACAMAMAVRRHSAASVILKDASPEQSLFWHQHGVNCKARVDLPRTGYLADLKTASDASPTGFARACATLGYHRQAAHYLDGFEAVTGDAPAGFVFVVVESEEPYSVGVYELDAADIDLGRRQMERAAVRFAAYMDDRERNYARTANAGYGETVQRINLPAWAHYQDES